MYSNLKTNRNNIVELGTYTKVFILKTLMKIDYWLRI